MEHRAGLAATGGRRGRRARGARGDAATGRGHVARLQCAGRRRAEDYPRVAAGWQTARADPRGTGRADGIGHDAPATARPHRGGRGAPVNRRDALAPSAGRGAAIKRVFLWFFDLVTQNGGLEGIVFDDVRTFIQRNGEAKADDVVCEFLAGVTGGSGHVKDAACAAQLWRGGRRATVGWNRWCIAISVPIPPTRNGATSCSTARGRWRWARAGATAARTTAAASASEPQTPRRGWAPGR